MAADNQSLELTRLAAAGVVKKGGTDLVAFDVSEQLALTDVFLLCTVNNQPQMRAVIDEVENRLRHAGVKAVRREGEREGVWVLLDFGDIVVHVQQAEDRQYYGLDRLWSDCPRVELAEQ